MYGVLSGRVVGTRREGRSDTPHHQVHLVDDAGVHHRAAVNVLSQQAPSELLYLADPPFRHPVLAALPPAGSGWTRLPQAPGSANLDFIRGNLFDPAAMRPLPPDVTGPDNDLADLLDHYMQRGRRPGRRRARPRPAPGGLSPASRTRSSASGPATASATST